MQKRSVSVQEENDDDDTIRVGDFIFFIERITNNELVKIKHALPVKEYRLLKNRKAARESRRKRKQEMIDSK
eukprot:CAMPEP_0176378638 /NCGR_PEP_ID=MMETSP0126-20121128/29773_1 /TAXON_ID=141414 ORGANISM="Strombidinopsis acuminatum, Strain SPMC142" /NCGR_SAMPLE_ID=MMETSP0126 /ASSEMBLY_ACC=CAM_ASM_000229 /LENGTH=71 /DNA_ID=CAMNT_0017741045 /DNA_START=187 /DNA_END=402 /DNA_ORIENTATION=-